MSVSTVSRVFNGYDDVSQATRERVLDVARRLDYAPSAAARTLVKQQSQLIGVVLFTGYEHPDIHHPFFQEVLVGLKHGIGELGYDLLLFATEQPGSSRGRPHSYLRRARQHRVDGIVVMGVDRDDPEVEKLVRADIPVMAVDLDVVHDHTSFVASDNIGGARLAVRHLNGLGHTRIAADRRPAQHEAGSGPNARLPGGDARARAEDPARLRDRGRLLPGERRAGDAIAASAGRAADRRVRGGRHDGRRGDPDDAGRRPVGARTTSRSSASTTSGSRSSSPRPSPPFGRTWSASGSPPAVPSSSRSRTPTSRRRC